MTPADSRANHGIAVAIHADFRRSGVVCWSSGTPGWPPGSGSLILQLTGQTFTLIEGGQNEMPPTLIVNSPQAIAPLTEDEFRSMVSEWKCGTAFVSSVSEIIGHPGFRRIVASGAGSVPYLLKELKREPSYLVMALGEITGVNPVPPDVRGKITEMVKAWLAWGEQNGLLR